MAHRKINSDSTDFTIPKHANNEKGKEIKIKLASTGKYDLYQKDFPANLPAGYDWINSFGLKSRPKETMDSKDSDPYPDVVDAYIIELDDVEGKEPVYFDGSNVQNFPMKKTDVGNRRVQVSLALGDPPVGWPKT